MSGGEGGFLSRWSRRKHEAAKAPEAPPEAKPGPAPAAPGQATSAAAVAPAQAAPDEPPELPPVESLTPESDFSPFMGDRVDPQTRRDALKTLFKDPRFNVMDGLDVYIDDYSKPDPIPPEWLGQLAQMAGLGDVAGREKAEREAREAAAAAAGKGDDQPGDGTEPGAASGADSTVAPNGGPGAEIAPGGMGDDCQAPRPEDLSGSKKPHEI